VTDAAGAPLTPYNYRVNGPLAGLFVGGNYQLNKIVLGVEGDWQWSNLIGNSQMGTGRQRARKPTAPAWKIRPAGGWGKRARMKSSGEAMKNNTMQNGNIGQQNTERWRRQIVQAF
jgi:hypothetical protein